MKVVRFNGVWATLSRVLSSPAGRKSIDYISLTPLEREELTLSWGVQFTEYADGRVTMDTAAWYEGGEDVVVRIEAQDKYSRARRKSKGDGRVQTR